MKFWGADVYWLRNSLVKSEIKIRVRSTENLQRFTWNTCKILRIHSTITTTTNDNNWPSGDFFFFFFFFIKMNSAMLTCVSDAPACSLEYVCYSWWGQLTITLYEVGDLERLTRSKMIKLTIPLVCFKWVWCMLPSHVILNSETTGQPCPLKYTWLMQKVRWNPMDPSQFLSVSKLQNGLYRDRGRRAVQK